METVMLEELSWPQVERLLDTGQVDTAIVVIGATEQHGPQLPLATDSLIAEAVGRELARRLGRALLAPPIRVGCSEHHLPFPGTISVGQETLTALVTDYVTSLARHGFKNVVLLPIHGGNFGAVVKAVRKLRAGSLAARVVEGIDLGRLTKVMGESSAEFGVSPEASGIHAGEYETSLILALRPELVHMERAVLGYLGLAVEVARRLYVDGFGPLSEDGVLGDPRLASAKKGRVYFDRFVDDLVEFVASRIADADAADSV